MFKMLKSAGNIPYEVTKVFLLHSQLVIVLIIKLCLTEFRWLKQDI